MRNELNRLGLFVLLVGVVGCGGSLGNPTGAGGTTGAGATTGAGGTTGTGGSGGAAPCSSLGGCDCLASNRCVPRSEACWCPTECYPGAPIDCICGGGRFLACEDSVTAACSSELAAVQAKCADQSFVQYIGELCSSVWNPTCVSACLANLNRSGSCTEIDCSFCPVCDCAAPTKPSAFSTCLQACYPVDES
jgi:hypothetical protein